MFWNLCDLLIAFFHMVGQFLKDLGKNNILDLHVFGIIESNNFSNPRLLASVF